MRILQRKYSKTGLDSEYLFDLLMQTKGRCIITDVPLDFEFKDKYSPYIPSLDRVDSNKGYFKSNVQFISWGANRMKGKYASTEEVVEFFKLIKKNFFN